MLSSHRNFISNIGVILAFLSLFYSCAYEVAPRGGQKDLIAPKMTKSFPLDSSLNFKGNKIKFTFDEFVKVDKPKDNILISPPVGDIKEVFVQGKSVVILLGDTLQTESTYEVLLSGAIKDLNEGNVLKEERIRFSTGAEMDTFKLYGNVVNYLDNKGVKGIKVLLFRDLSDSAYSKSFPTYVSQTDDQGRFAFENLKEGSYNILALNDVNYSLNFDISTEEIAFYGNSIDIKTVSDTNWTYINDLKDTIISGVDTLTNPMKSIKNILSLVDVELLYFKSAKTNFFFSKRKPRNFGGVMAQFNSEIDSFKVKPLMDSIEFKIDFNDGSDSLRIWQTVVSGDTVLYEVIINDSQLVDTLRLYHPQIDSTHKLWSKYQSPIAFKWDYIKPNIFYNHPPRMLFSNPIKSFNTDSFKVYQNDSLVNAGFNIDSNGMFVEILYDWKEKSSYKFFMRDSMIEDYNGRYNDSLILNVKTRLVKSYGNLDITLQDSLSRDMIMFVYKGKDIFKTYHLEDSISVVELPFLQPGVYTLKFIWDKNHDDKWTTGDLIEKRLPERFYDYPGQLNIKGGFDLHQEIDLSNISFE